MYVFMLPGLGVNTFLEGGDQGDGGEGRKNGAGAIKRGGPSSLPVRFFRGRSFGVGGRNSDRGSGTEGGKRKRSL